MTGSSSASARSSGSTILAADPDFATNPARVTNRVRLREALISALAGWERDRLLPLLDAAGVPASPINNIAQMFEDPQVIARGLRLDLDDGHGNSLPSVRSPMRLSETPLAYDRPRRGSASIRPKSSPNWRRNEAG